MTAEDKTPNEDRHSQTLDEICENTRAIRRVANRILDHLHDYSYTGAGQDSGDPDTVSWEDLYDNDDMYL